MIYHVLNGDAVAGRFDLEGEIVICREALIEGDLTVQSLDQFWQARADFFKDDSYFEKVKAEFDKLDYLRQGDEVNLWFGNEAFCQVNLWFILWLFSDTEATFYRVFPDSNDWDCTFEDLSKCFAQRQKLTKEEIHLGQRLWKAFCLGDLVALKLLSEESSPNFKNLAEIGQALIEKDKRPQEVLHEIVETGETDFGNIFRQFRAKAGIYGFGDTQVRNLLNRI